MRLQLITAQDIDGITLPSGGVGAEGGVLQGEGCFRRSGAWETSLGSVLVEWSEAGLAKEWVRQENKQMGNMQWKRHPEV